MKKFIGIIFIIVATIVFSSAVYIKVNRLNSNTNKSILKPNTSKENKKEINSVKAKESDDSPGSKKDTLTFSVLGDVHGNAGRLDNAINDLHSVNEDMDAMILNGDNVDEGLLKQYDAINYILSEDAKLLPKTVIKNIGNHDYYDYARGQNNEKDVENFKNLYYNFSGEKSVYHDKWIKGYHFISLGSESGNTKDVGGVNAYLSEKQLSWLKSKLEENHENGKPIFVFLHQHLCTSIKGWNGIIQKNKLIKILSEYPEVILFTSHTHVMLTVDNVKPYQRFTTAHTGSVHYAIEPEGYSLKRLYEESQGLYVEVKGNKTTIKGRDFIRKSWIFSKEVP